MTKKDYKLIASAFSELLKPYGDQGGLDSEDFNFCRGIERAAGMLAEKLATDNTQFNTDKFLGECGVVFKLDAMGK